MCRDGLILATDKSCIEKCRYPCSACTTSPTNCSACISGYTYSNNTCIPDLSCNNNSTCKVCPLEYTLRLGKCYVCNGGLNCLGCASGNASLCLTCRRGYYLVSTASSNTCKQCPSECSVCTDSGSCTSCKDGFFLVGSSCTVCDSTCATCFGNAKNC